LRGFSPFVEADPAIAGIFWLDGAGLTHLYPRLETWVDDIYSALEPTAGRAAVVLGFTRFGTYALARARSEMPGVFILDTPEAEARAVKALPLRVLGMHPNLCDDLQKLGVATVHGFLRLPADGLCDRFGTEALRIHQLANQERFDPLQPETPPVSFREQIQFDEPERDATRLVFALRRALDSLLGGLSKHRMALASLALELRLDRVPQKERHVIRPAEPTLDARILQRLIHVRLESKPPRAGVTVIDLFAEEVPATREQLQLFREKPRRNLRDANDALAGLRAEFGNDCVVKAVLKDGHLPEARFAWEPMQELERPAPVLSEEVRPLVRRVFGRPQALPLQEGDPRNDGWLLTGLERGPIMRLSGAFVLSGGWWHTEIQREYHYAETQDGECLWVFYDRRRRRWFLHGAVE
jgi:protein ImuB